MNEQPAQRAESEAVVRRRRDRVSGLLIISVAFCATLSISWWAKIESMPEPSKPPPPPSPEGLAGFPEKVDPLQALDVARAKTPRDLLRGFVIEGAASDGTVNVHKAGGRIRYVFQSSPGRGPQPARDDMGPPRHHYCGKQTVHVRRPGVIVDEDVPAVKCPAKPVESLPDPRCGPDEVWKHALDLGAPERRLARIEYYRSRVGPAWRFAIPGSRYRFSLYGDCGRELPAHEAVGTVR
jgi:hypothetical protein